MRTLSRVGPDMSRHLTILRECIVTSLAPTVERTLSRVGPGMYRQLTILRECLVTSLVSAVELFLLEQSLWCRLAFAHRVEKMVCELCVTYSGANLDRLI